MFEAATLWEIGRVGGILWWWCAHFTGEAIIPNFIGLKLPSRVSEPEKMAVRPISFSVMA